MRQTAGQKCLFPSWFQVFAEQTVNRDLYVQIDLHFFITLLVLVTFRCQTGMIRGVVRSFRIIVYPIERA